MSDLSVSRADMLRELNRGALDDFWDALARSGKDAAKIYRNDAVLRTPQDGGQIIGRPT